MATVPFTLTTLPLGQHDLGSTSIPTTITAVTCLLDRTVTGGFNSLTAGTTVSLSVSLSLDAGVTWTQILAATVVGGVWTSNVTGLTQPSSWIACPVPSPGVARNLKATMVVAGTVVAVAGTLTIT